MVVAVVAAAVVVMTLAITVHAQSAQFSIFTQYAHAARSGPKGTIVRNRQLATTWLNHRT